jgi:hypothetical protein
MALAAMTLVALSLSTAALPAATLAAGSACLLIAPALRAAGRFLAMVGRRSAGGRRAFGRTLAAAAATAPAATTATLVRLTRRIAGGLVRRMKTVGVGSVRVGFEV